MNARISNTVLGLGIEGAEGEGPVVDPGHRDDFGIVSRRKDLIRH